MDSTPLSGRRVRLRPVEVSDYEYLYLLATHPDVAWRWRNRGRSISLDAFVHQLTAGTLVHFVIERNANAQRIGYVQAFNASEANGWCHIALMLDPSVDGGGWAIEAPVLFLHHLFTTWNFRKLYATIVEFNFAHVASFAGDRYRIEGRLANNEWHDGRYWDLLILALYRSDWEHIGPRLVEVLTRGLPQAVDTP